MHGGHRLRTLLGDVERGYLRMAAPPLRLPALAALAAVVWASVGVSAWEWLLGSSAALFALLNCREVPSCERNLGAATGIGALTLCLCTSFGGAEPSGAVRGISMMLVLTATACHAMTVVKHQQFARRLAVLVAAATDEQLLVPMAEAPRATARRWLDGDVPATPEVVTVVYLAALHAAIQLELGRDRPF